MPFIITRVMNFLAHFHLATITQTSLTGALLGDFLRGQQHLELAPELELGVRLHRKVDVLSEQMPNVQRVKQQFGQGQRRYIGIVTDMLLDYLLSKHWASFHSDHLANYSQQVYQALQPLPDLAPSYERVRLAMTQGNWLCRYGTEDEILHALQRISLRLKRPAPLATLGEECLQQHKALLERALFDDYPLLQQQLVAWLATQKIS